MVLTLTSEQLNIIRHHAEATYPEECCGLLLGKVYDGETQLIEVWPTKNNYQPENATPVFTEESLTKERRYVVDPKEMLRAQKQGRDRGLNIIGIYHSHPDHRAIPSQCDREYAWPEYLYIIVSVLRGAASDIHCWSLDADRQFQPTNFQLSA